MHTQTVVYQNPSWVWAGPGNGIWQGLELVLASLVPRPHPAFRRLQYRTASDEKLGVGLGMRPVPTFLTLFPYYFPHSQTVCWQHSTPDCRQ